MPMYTYQARNQLGRPQAGSQEATSAQALARELRQQGWLVLDVKPVNFSDDVSQLLPLLNPFSWLPPRSFDIEMSLQQMAVMLRSGLTLLTALRNAAENSTRHSMTRLLLSVADQIQHGSSFADALAEHRSIPPMVVHLARVGEQTGTLDAVLTRAAESLERRRLLRSQLISALAYPAIVFFAAIGVAVFMIVSVIPKLEVFLRALGRRLPPITQALLDVSSFVQQYGLWIVVGLFALTGVTIALYLWPPSRMVMDRCLLRVPIVGALLRLAATVQFCYGLSVLLKSGITLVEGLRTVEQMQNNRWLGARIAEARTAVVRGSPLAKTLSESAILLPLTTKMVAVGEATGTLDDTTDEMAKFHTQVLQGAIRWLSMMVEPMIVLFVGGIVGFVYIAFFVALFSAAGGR